MRRLPCPYLGGEVELSSERERHIADHHPDLLPERMAHLEETLASPNEVRRSKRFGNAQLFSRWYADARTGKHVIVVVVSDTGPPPRHWVITAYRARKLAEGEVEWPTS